MDPSMEVDMENNSAGAVSGSSAVASNPNTTCEVDTGTQCDLSNGFRFDQSSSSANGNSTLVNKDVDAFPAGVELRQISDQVVSLKLELLIMYRYNVFLIVLMLFSTN